MKLQYWARVDEEGKLLISNKKKFQREVLATFPGKEVTLTIERRKKRRSSEQNAYLWGVVYTHALEGFKQLGNLGLTTEDIHEFFKGEFLKGRKLKLKGGMAKDLIPSTRELDTMAMSDYIEQIKIFSAEMLNINIPDAEERKPIEL